MSILAKVINGFNSMSIKMLMTLFREIEKKNPKIHVKPQRP